MPKKYKTYLFIAAGVVLVLVFLLAPNGLIRRLQRGDGHPGQYLLNGQWDRILLDEAPALPQEQPAFRVTIVASLPEDIELLVENPTGESVRFEEPFRPSWRSLEVLLEGGWYTVPKVYKAPVYMTVPQGSGYPEGLRPGTDWTFTYTAAQIEEDYNWSQLPAGTYRLRWMEQLVPLEK